MLKIIIISRSLGELEIKLLQRNCKAARRVFSDISVAYIVGDHTSVTDKVFSDPSVYFFCVSNSPFERNAALSRGIGFDALKIEPSDLVLFLDGDMLVREKYLRFLHSLNHRSFLALSSRLDIRYNNGRLRFRRLRFKTDETGHLVSLYGSMAMRGIPFNKFNLMTHDMEEQWFLRGLGTYSLVHELYQGIGILHFDRFAGMSRIIRYFISSRGVGFWQGLLRDFSLIRIYQDVRFILNQKTNPIQVLAFLVVSLIALPKILFFRIPKKLSYLEFSNEYS